MWGMNGFGGWGVMGFGMLLFWVVVAIAVAALAGFLRRGPAHPERGARSAREILEERYARGKIERAEFEQKLHDLAR